MLPSILLPSDIDIIGTNKKSNIYVLNVRAADINKKKSNICVLNNNTMDVNKANNTCMLNKISIMNILNM